jgi:hypothetical protein
MKSLFSILCLSFLSLTLTNCSLSPEQIASRLKPSNEVSLVSAKGVDYRKLRDLLKAKKWKEADEETRVKILKVANRESEGWLRVEDAENFSCQDLGTIDKLWVKYSNGKFGFSVQKQIYQGVGGSKEYNWDDYKKFADKVGWLEGGEWLLYSELTFSDKHNTGHLPRLWGEKERQNTRVGKGGRTLGQRDGEAFFSHVNCNI